MTDMIATITDEERKNLRRTIGQAVISVQDELRHYEFPAVVIPEILAALLSLAAFIAAKNAGMSRFQFEEAAALAADENYGSR